MSEASNVRNLKISEMPDAEHLNPDLLHILKSASDQHYTAEVVSVTRSVEVGGATVTTTITIER